MLLCARFLHRALRATRDFKFAEDIQLELRIGKPARKLSRQDDRFSGGQLFWQLAQCGCVRIVVRKVVQQLFRLFARVDDRLFALLIQALISRAISSNAPMNCGAPRDSRFTISRGENCGCVRESA